MAIYNIPQLGGNNWFCEQGTCYQSPNGTLTYAQCKGSCTDYPCSMFFEMCQDYNMVIAGNHPTFSTGNVSALLGHWVNMYALPTMGGHNFTKPQLFAFIQECCHTRRGKMLDLKNPTGTPQNDVRIGKKMKINIK